MANQFSNISFNTNTILKPYFEGPVVSQFNDMVPLYKAAEKGSEQFVGQSVQRPLKIRRNPGIGATSDGGNLPAIGRQTSAQATIVAKYNYLRAGITAPAIAASANDRGAFIKLMSYELEQGVLDLKSDVNRQMFFSGLGTQARANAAAVATTVVTFKGRTDGESGNKYIDIGMVFDIYDSTGVTLKAQAVTVNAISGTTIATVTFDQSVTVAANDILVKTGALNNEIQGLLTFLDGGTTTIYGIDRSTATVFQGNSIDAASGQLSLALMQQAVSEARRRGDGDIDAIFCDYDSERMYNKLLVADKRYIGEKAMGDGTFLAKDKSYLAFGNVPMVADKDCTGNSMFMLTSKGWKKYVLGKELAWADESGSQMIVQPNADSFELRLRLWANTFHEKPSGCARLFGYISP